LKNLGEARSQSSAMAARLISQMKITRTRDPMATGVRHFVPEISVRAALS